MARKESTTHLTAKRGYLRYAVAFLLLTGIAFNYMVKVMLSVAVVAMVKRQSSSNATNVTTAGTCPGEVDDDSDGTQDGPFDWDEEEQGEILASYFYGYVATQLLGGWAADNLGGRWVFGPGLFLSGLFSVLSPWAAKIDSKLFMAMRAVQGIGSGVLLPAATVLLSKWFTLEERPRVAGFVLSANFGGTLVSMSVSGILVDALGWESVFYIFGGACVLFILPWMYFVHNTPEVHPRISDWEREHVISGRQLNSSGSEELEQEHEQARAATPWISILTSHRFWVLVGVSSGTAWINFTLLTQLPKYITNVLHFSLKKSGWISGLPYLFGWISAGLFGMVSSWLRVKKLITQINVYRIFTSIACVGPALSLTLVVLLGCDTVAIVACFIATTVMMCAYWGGAVTQHLDLAPNYAGATTGILYTVLNSTGIIAPLVIGAILKNAQDTVTGWRTVFYVTMAVSVTPYIFYLLFATDKEQSWNRPKIAKRNEIHPTR